MSTFIRSGHPYVAPAGWRRKAGPCKCRECPPCSEWETINKMTTLTYSDGGKCYVAGNGNISILLPYAETITGPWCVTIIADSVFPYSARVLPQDFSGTVTINGIVYLTAYVENGGVMCVCYEGNSGFSATGDAIGVSPQ